MKDLFHIPGKTHTVTDQNRDYTALKISIETLEKALKKLCKDKAIGVDHLKDSQLRTMLSELPIKIKIVATFNLWLAKNQLPSYLQTARVIALSKDDSNYPSFGKVRPIAILPALYKLLELSILIELDKELIAKPLPECQRGFRANRSIYTNLQDLSDFAQKAIEKAYSDRANNIRPSMRHGEYILLMDLEKAFDKVDRTILIQKLQTRGLSP